MQGYSTCATSTRHAADRHADEWVDDSGATGAWLQSSGGGLLQLTPHTAVAHAAGSPAASLHFCRPLSGRPNRRTSSLSSRTTRVTAISVHFGNPVVKTPNLDAFAKTSVRLRNFHVSPVCSPTRSSLLTGLYNYRTGVVDTSIGRSMMRPDVKTLPEYLAAAGYRTGLFGKWHLGDNYPLRPEDGGFQETLWHKGGGLAQPSDPPGSIRRLLTSIPF